MDREDIINRPFDGDVPAFAASATAYLDEQAHWTATQLIDERETADDRDLAAEARAGGRLITKAIANLVQYDGVRYASENITALRKGTQEQVNAVWRMSIDASGGNGKKGWRWSAQSSAGMGRFPDTPYEEPETAAIMMRTAEAMTEWPIVKAAYRVDVLSTLQNILWPLDDPDRDWSPDTLDDIALTLERAGYGRPEGAASHGQR